MITYESRIIEYMKTHKGITVGECRDHIGTTELRRRICDLKDKGYDIKSVWEEGPNSNGTTSRFCRYFLIKEPDHIQKKVAKMSKKLNEKLDKKFDPLYHYDYIKMLDDLRMIRTEGNKKNDKSTKCEIIL